MEPMEVDAKDDMDVDVSEDEGGEEGEEGEGDEEGEEDEEDEEEKMEVDGL